LFEEIYEKIKFSALNIVETKNRLMEPEFKLCPYQYARCVHSKVNILLCPYNYVLSPNIRKLIGLDV
jgi:hypothetical protein